MSRAEVWSTSLWEMQDMISALAIYNGNAKQIHKKKLWTMEEVLALK